MIFVCAYKLFVIFPFSPLKEKFISTESECTCVAAAWYGDWRERERGWKINKHLVDPFDTDFG